MTSVPDNLNKPYTGRKVERVPGSVMAGGRLKASKSVQDKLSN